MICTPLIRVDRVNNNVYWLPTVSGRELRFN